MNRYSFQLLRYVPNTVAQEFYNIGVFLFNQSGRLVDARFAPDFRRLRCHPLADLAFLESLRNEFEERRLLGEGFSEYAAELRRNLSTALQLSDPETFFGHDAGTEIDRLHQTYVVTPRRESEGSETREAAPGTRRALRQAMEQAFRRYHLLDNGNRLTRDASVAYGGPRMRFTFDYAYQPNGITKYLHGVALRNDVDEAAKLCFVIDRLRGSAGAADLTAVVDDQILEDTRALLHSSSIQTCEVSRLDELSLSIRGELGL